MKDHDNDVIESSVEKSTVTVDSTAVDGIATERLDSGVRKTEEFLAKRDEREDTMVDVFGTDVVDVENSTEVNLEGEVCSDGLVKERMEIETITHDLVLEKVSDTGEGVSDDLVGSRVLTFPKAEVTVKEEGVKRSVEASKDVGQENDDPYQIATGCDDAVQKDGISVQDSELNFESLSGEPQVVGGDIGVIDDKDPTERGLTDEVMELQVSTVEEVAAGHETVDRELQFVGEKSSINREEVSERGLSEEVMDQPTECDQEMADGDHVAHEKIVEEYETFDSSSISKPLTTTNPGFEDVDVVVVDEDLAFKDVAQADVSVDSTLVCPDNRRLLTEGDNVYVHADQQAEVSNLSIKESLHPEIEATRNHDQIPENVTGVRDSKLAVGSSNKEPQFEEETDVIVREETERGLGTNEEIVDQPTEFVQRDGCGDGVTDEKDREGYEILDSSKIPESLTTVNLDPDSVLPSKSKAEFSLEQSIPATANKGIEIDNEGQNHVVELPITDEMSVSIEDQGLKAEIMSVKPSNDNILFNSGNEVPSNGEMNGFQVPVDAFEEVNGVTRADVDKHGVLPEDMEFSYEDAQMERGEDAGVDIDEVLGWKDEMPGTDALSGNAGCPEKDQQCKSNVNSKADICEQVLTGHREENFKSQEPIVYERRVHVEVPLYDALDGSRSPLLEDENLKVETDSEDDDEFVEAEELKVTEEPTGIDEVPKHLENESFVSLHQSCYFQPPEREGQFSVSDLVWGKVRSHPWWPGQIIDPSDASEKAMRYHKKDCFLVAYFGDGTFAWNDSAVLKPFRANFSQIQKHANLESFKNAVSCALEEVSRRVELGLACSCVPQGIYEKFKYQVVENGGVRRKSMKKECRDESASVSSFEPDKLVDYVRQLAWLPGEGDDMELAMAKAQLSAYGRYKGYRQPPEFQFCGNIWEDASIPCEGVEQVTIPYEDLKEVNNDGENASKKFENSSMDITYPYNERSLSDLTDDAQYSGDGDVAEGDHITSKSNYSSGSRKRKARGSLSDSSVKRPNLHPDKVSSSVVSAPKPSFKVGERIRRVANQLSGPTKVENGQHSEKLVESAVSLEIPKNSQMGKEESVAEMLSQLHLTALNPMKGYSFLNTIIQFFYERRTAVYSKSLKQHTSVYRPETDRKRKTSNETNPQEFEFDDVNDAYWTDRIIQNHSEEQFLQDNQNEGLEYEVVAYESDKPAKARRRSNKKQKRLSDSNHEKEVEEEESELDELRRQNLPTEIILKFTEGVYFPSEIHLNKMFRRFGPLMESETEVNRQNGHARVIFKKCCDAEVAQSSAANFNIFGSINVNYELNYTPLVSYKPLPLPTSQDPMDGS